MTKRSPLAPASLPPLPDIDGLKLAVAQSGMRYKDRLDLMLIYADAGTQFAGVFTQSTTASSAVRISRQVIEAGRGRAILSNAGNANAFTGTAGDEAIKIYLTAFAKTLGLEREQFALASTGVIGEPMDGHLLAKQAGVIAQNLGHASWEQAATAIRTTDTFSKTISKKITIEGVAVTINGIAKGAGMIAPNMATMLGYIGTDACISRLSLQILLNHAVDKSFNAITVDSDMSTSDSVFVMATQKAKHEPITSPTSAAARIFYAGLEEVMIALAQMIVRDGEGASKFITITVTGAIDEDEARLIALSIGNSPLVKTAIAGEDANWGRIVMAVGKADAEVQRDKLSISIGGYKIAVQGEGVADFDDAHVTKHMKGQEIDIDVDIGLGRGMARIWTCDLTHDYIAINADYRS